MPFLSPNQQCQSTEGKKSSYVTVAGKGREGDVVSRQHCKGCNCKRSGCLKNYCECYEVNFRLSFISFSTSVAVNVKLPVHLWTYSQSVVDGVMLVFVGHPEPYARHLTNVEVQLLDASLFPTYSQTRHLRLFGHIAHSSLQEDHYCAVAPDWKRPLGRPSHTWGALSY